MYATPALLVVLTAFAGHPEALQQAQGGRVERLLAQAAKALEAESAHRALALVRQAWRLEPGKDATARLYAAAILRVATDFLDKKEIARARDLFRQGRGLFPKVAALHLGSGQVEVEALDTKSAEAHFRRAIQLDRKLTPALVALGSLLYDKRAFEEAHKLLRRALVLDPKNQVARTLLQRNEDDKVVERGFARHSSKHFRLSYHGEHRGLDKHQAEILAYLETCHVRMKQLLRKTPKRRIEVVLYTKTEFRLLNRNADWVAAYYDGRVRIPLDSWAESKTRVQATIRHELTHAFLHELYGPLSSWLHEGIAQRIEGIDEKHVRARVAEHPFVKAKKLRRSFILERNPRKAQFLYDQAFLVFREIEQRLGSRGLVPLFERIARKRKEPLAKREDEVLKRLLGFDLDGMIRITARASGAAQPAK